MFVVVFSIKKIFFILLSRLLKISKGILISSRKFNYKFQDVIEGNTFVLIQQIMNLENSVSNFN